MIRGGMRRYVWPCSLNPETTKPRPSDSKGVILSQPSTNTSLRANPLTSRLSQRISMGETLGAWREKKAVRSLVLSLCLVAIVWTASAVYGEEVVPSSYQAPVGNMGWLVSYVDETGSQLIDGAHGGPWSAESGFPGWYDYDYVPWVAWDGGGAPRTVSIVFTFPSLMSLQVIDLWTLKDTAGAIYIPQSVVVSTYNDSTGWSVGASNTYDDSLFADGRRHTLTIPIVASQATAVRLELMPSNNRWVFLDEADFYSTPVPEPSGLLVVASCVGSLCLVSRRRK
jgi:hypothetical protein